VFYKGKYNRSSGIPRRFHLSESRDGVSHAYRKHTQHTHEVGGMQEQMSRKREREALAC
jgi:hypothetical protein